MNKEEIMRIFEEEYTTNQMDGEGHNSDLKIKLYQTTEQFARTFDHEMPAAYGVKGRIKTFIKRVIRKTVRFVLKPYAEQMLRFQESICELAGMYIDKYNEIDEAIYDTGQKYKKLNTEYQILKECYEKISSFSENVRNLEQRVQDHEKAVQELTYNCNKTDEKVLRFIEKDEKIKKYLDGGAVIDSYSQAGEDRIISFILNTLGEKKQGFYYLYIGCNRYEEINNNYYF